MKNHFMGKRFATHETDKRVYPEHIKNSDKWIRKRLI